MLQVFLNLLAQAEGLLIGEKLIKTNWSHWAAEGDPSKVVLKAAWVSGGNSCEEVFTEQELEDGRFNDKLNCFTFNTHLGGEVLVRLVKGGSFMAPPADYEPTVHVVIQEGGATGELYVNGYDTRADAEAFRTSAADAAYLTSEVIPVPMSLANHPRFFEVTQALIRATTKLDMPESA